MVEKLIKIYKNKIIQNIKEFDYNKYYYFYSNNYNDEVFGIEKTISENEYHLIKSSYIEKRIYNNSSSIQKIYEYLFENRPYPFKNKKAKILVIDSTYPEFKELLLSFYKEVELILIDNLYVAFCFESYNSNISSFISTLSDDLGINFKLHDGITFTNEIKGSMIRNYLGIIKVFLSNNEELYTDVAGVLLSNNSEIIKEYITIIEECLLKPILKDSITKDIILTYFKNSFIITIASTAISVLIVSMAAYVSARMEFKLKGLITLMFSTTLFIPAISISLPIYQLLGNLGLKDTHLGVIFIYSGLGIATTYFILRSYFLTIPKEMEEAARIDGCGYVGSFFRIIVPIAKPGISTAAIMAFLNNWNEFYFASILLKSKEKMTLPALLGQFTTAYSKNLNGMFSAIIVTVVPTIIIFWIFSETFVKSLTAGAVKG